MYIFKLKKINIKIYQLFIVISYTNRLNLIFDIEKYKIVILMMIHAHIQNSKNISNINT